jgi:hypothetical protein
MIMGLDMFAFAAKTVKPNPSDEHSIVVGFEREDKEYEYFDGRQPEEIFYWRKFNALHGWMQNLYESRGGTQSFNCIRIQLFTDDLEALKEACKSKSLVPVNGFFFGSQDPVDDDDYASVLKFITVAEEYIRDGFVVYYDSWW